MLIESNGYMKRAYIFCILTEKCDDGMMALSSADRAEAFPTQFGRTLNPQGTLMLLIIGECHINYRNADAGLYAPTYPNRQPISIYRMLRFVYARRKSIGGTEIFHKLNY